MGPHDATAVKQFVSYARLPKSPTEKLDTSSDNNLVAPSPKPSGVIQILKDSFKSLDSCPRELW
eukprot:CAMPEP_0119035694 /NCGR_PEP_ID=MMETSP1177-20130426/2893_1 /TAXON_ID=2985 /ORGANISM="Ochromonas sp, Strain CCMP1899" /LENGTH=63 /DNA_ID=CAMNT_0006994363 /DNA_START=139 /DNA_END=327 /DNA_ORIENTATION=-